jgi:hypothetical protein
MGDFVAWLSFAFMVANIAIAAISRDLHSGLGWLTAAMWQGAAAMDWIR